MREREQKFCEAVAAGESYSAAYVVAGYPANRGNASRLAKRPHINERIAELKALQPAAETVPEAGPVADGIEDGNDRLAQLRRLREAGVANKQINAAVAAEREAIRHEREQAKGRGKEKSDEEIIKQFLEQSRRTGAGIQEWQVRRLMGVVHLVSNGAAK
jgi:phage terminase small subunit